MSRQSKRGSNKDERGERIILPRYERETRKCYLSLSLSKSDRESIRATALTSASQFYDLYFYSDTRQDSRGSEDVGRRTGGKGGEVEGGGWENKRWWSRDTRRMYWCLWKRCAEDRRDGAKRGEDANRGGGGVWEKAEREKKRNEIRSRHPSRFRTERTSRGALYARAQKFRRGAARGHINFATVLNGILRRTFAREHIFHLRRRSPWKLHFPLGVQL